MPTTQRKASREPAMGKKGAAGGGEDILPLRGSAEAGPGPASRVVYIGCVRLARVWRGGGSGR